MPKKTETAKSAYAERGFFLSYSRIHQRWCITHLQVRFGECKLYVSKDRAMSKIDGVIEQF